MFNALDDHSLDGIVSRVEQSRLAYNIQTEEFRNLNDNFKNYLNEIKKIDDENHDLQTKIEQLRTNYISTLENHLKRLPADFRQQSRTLTQAHIERYKSKSHARRFINEREEIKKRIQFLVNNEKAQTKNINNLQKFQSSIQRELKNINEQVVNVQNFVENEKEKCRQAMIKVDELQIQLEHIHVERSKTEFEIQTLREELKLMQTAKEFLDEERQIILSTRSEADEYLLSCLYECIANIRNDFSALNQVQMKQIENEYKQMMTTLEENSLATANLNERMRIRQSTIQSECEKLLDENRSMTQELILFNDLNQTLAEKILSMEADLSSIRDERMKVLIAKDDELEQTKLELENLNEKLHHLADYDRNLKFELTLYRGVLEGEYRRKQQQLLSTQYPLRPTTLHTVPIGSHKNSSTLLTNHDELESIVEKANARLNEILLMQKQAVESTEDIVKEVDLTENLEQPSLTVVDDQRTNSTIEQSSKNVQENSETPKFPTSPIVLEDENYSYNICQSPSSSSGVQIYLITAAENQQPSLANEIPLLTEIYRPPPQHSEVHRSSSIPVSIEQEPSSGLQRSSEDQKSTYENLTLSSEIFEDRYNSSSIYQILSTVAQDAHVLSKFTMSDEPTLTEAQQHFTMSKDIPATFKVEQLTTTHLEDEQILEDVERQFDISVNENPMTSGPADTQQQGDVSVPSIVPDEPSISVEMQQTSTIEDNVQTSTPVIIVDEHSTIPAVENITEDGASIVHKTTDVADEDVINDKNKILTINGVENLINNDDSDVCQLDQSTDSLTVEDYPTIHGTEAESLQFEAPHIIQGQKEQLESDLENIDRLLEQNELTVEEQMNTNTNEDEKFQFVSSPGYYGSLNDCTYYYNQQLQETSVCNAEEDGSSSFSKFEENNVSDIDESNLKTVMKDLRGIFRDLANVDELVEINHEFLNNLTDRLEFGDNFIRTLFDDLLKKYILQSTEAGEHSKTLDWLEFRDVLFPILTGRYTERHIRKIFSLFDSNKTGYLSLEQITELLELLQVDHVPEFTNSMIIHFNKTQDDGINIDELIELIKQTSNTNENILPDDIEQKYWYIQDSTDDESNSIQSISFEVPNILISAKRNDQAVEMINNGMILLGRIFKRLGPDVENKQLSANRPALLMQITNEFIHNNVQISTVDLQSFIELYLNKKQDSDCLISWNEFRDVFLPFVSGGMFLKNGITHWFDIFDEKNEKIISRQQILHFLRLLQISDSEKVFNRMIETSDSHANARDKSWTLSEFIFALDHVDELTMRTLPNTQQILHYDLTWLTKNAL